MEITIDELLKRGLATTIKNKEYYTSEQYVTPFLERTQKYNPEYIVQVKEADQLSRNPDLNTIYNRVFIQAVLPDEYSTDNHKQVIGFLYGLDVRKPLAKIFTNHLNMACLNMCVFNPFMINSQFIEPQSSLEYDAVDKFMEKTIEIKQKLDYLKNTFIKPASLMDTLGTWINRSLYNEYVSEYGKVKLSPDTVIDAYKLLKVDEESEYFTKTGEDISLFTAHNAFTKVVTHDKGKDIMNKFEKSCIVNDILGISNIDKFIK